MKSKRCAHRRKNSRPSLSLSVRSDAVQRHIVLQDIAIIENLKFDEKVELFQQLEILQGLRKGEQSLQGLSTVSQEIIRKYSTLSSNRDKANFAKTVKNIIFASLKQSIANNN